MRIISLAATLIALAILPTTAMAAPKKVFVRLSATNYTVVENGGQATVTVLRSGNVKATASVDYTTQDGTATQPGDYTATSGTLNFAANETRKTFTVPVIDNTTVGPASKKFSVKLSNLTSSSQTQLKVPSTATVTILDNDGPGSIDFSSATYSVVEGAGVATITVTRASNPNLVESVDYATSDGTATAPADYTSTSGTLTFNAGEMSKTFQIPVIDDSLFEGDENLSVTLSNPQNVTSPLEPPILGPTAAAGPATLTIVDDDVSTFTFHQATYSVAENGGNATITVDRSGATSIAASVDYATGGGSAAAGTDYTATSGTLNFAAGQTQASFQIPITDNATGGEPNKTVGLTLSVGGSQVDSAQLSIVDDDGGSSVQLSNSVYSVNEAAGTANLTVTLSHPMVSDVTVHVATPQPGSDTATAGSDYTAIDTDVTILAGQTSVNVPITIVNDTDSEDNETFRVTLSSPSGAVLGAPSSATVTILDDDSAGTLDFSAQRYDVNEHAGTATITVNRTGGSAGTASVDYATADGTAHEPADYTATHGTLSFADGETQKTFQVPVKWDGRQEGDETVSITLSNFDSDDDPGATKAAVLHIADDGASGPVQFSAPSYDVLENAGQATITVNRSGGSLGGPVTVDYATSDGTAHAGADYAAASGTLTFGPGEASKTFTVPVSNDNVHQGGRSLNLTLTNPGGGTSLGNQATATLTIGDDDPVTSSSKDLTAPKLKLTIKKGQKVSKTKRLVIKVRSNEAAKLAVKASLRKGKKLVQIAKGSKSVGQNKTITITLKLNKKALANLRAALAASKARGNAKIKVTVTGTDAAGNKRTVSTTVVVK